jgi:hypothetical protein
MTFQELLNSRAFFNIFLKNDTFFNSLKEKFPEILADLTSSRSNPNCGCTNRVKDHLNSKLINDPDYFNNLMNIDEIKNLTLQAPNYRVPNNPIENHVQMMQQNMFRNSGGFGRIFEIGKTEEDWKTLAKKLNEEKVFFKSFSIIEKPDKLVVYFI